MCFQQDLTSVGKCSPDLSGGNRVIIMELLSTSGASATGSISRSSRCLDAQLCRGRQSGKYLRGDSLTLGVCVLTPSNSWGVAINVGEARLFGCVKDCDVLPPWCDHHDGAQIVVQAAEPIAGDVRHAFVRDVIYTEGAKYVADMVGAHSLIDEIAFAQRHIPKLRNEDFQNWELVVVAGGSAVLICNNGNGHRLYAKQIGWTDFLAPGVRFYFCNETPLLPGSIEAQPWLL